MKFNRVIALSRVWLEIFRRNSRNLERIIILREENPGVSIGDGVLVVGRPGLIKIGRGTRIDNGVLLDFRSGGDLVMGENCEIKSGAVLSPHGGFIHAGNNLGVNHYTVLYGHGGLVVGDFVRFAAHSIVIPANHGIARMGLPIARQPLTKKGINVGNDVWVGGGCSILDGVSIGEGAVIAAGAVVNRDVEPYTVVAGVPAKVIRSRLAE